MSAQNTVRPNAESIAASVRAAQKGGGLPPVDKWDPPDMGEMDMVITREGTWIHEGTPITRAGLVRLFSTILRRDGDRYVLVTPVEKVGITVEDAPFVAVDMTVTGEGRDQTLTFLTNVGDETTAGPDHPIRIVQGEGEEPSPYVHVRGGLEALIDRKSFYRMVDLGTHREHEGENWFGLWSGGVFFPIIPSDALPD
ncbi:MAG: DUF1285 domain-containing protein [Pseudomonadota bacterium]|nr:DUF1285 domain-containing protein [Pseudomonadota bacterium]